MTRILTSALILTAAASFAAIPGAPTLVAGGPGDQTDPHISASTIAYTNNASGQSRIHYTNTTLLVSGSVPAAPAETDLLSDVSGNTIVFTRTLVDGTSNIYRYTTSEPVAVAITNNPAGEYTNAAVGGAYVAFEDRFSGSIIATPLTGGALTPVGVGVSPAVSADGTAIAFLANCPGTCDVSVSAPFSGFVTTDTGANSDGPGTGVDTNGSTVVFISGGDLAWVSVTGGAISTYTLAGADQNPNISGNLVAFEHSDGTQTDIYVKDISSGAAAVNVTNTLGVSETLNDVYLTGTRAEVVFARPSVTPGNGFDVYMTSFQQAAATTCTPPVNNGSSDDDDDDDDANDDDANDDDDDANDDDDDDANDDDDDANDDDDDANDDADDDDNNNGQSGCGPATAVAGASEVGSVSTPASEDLAQGQGNNDSAGCSATGAANAMWLVGLVGLFMMFRPTRAAARARRSRD